MPEQKNVIVIVPVYNVMDFLEECRQSLDAQTVADFSIIAVDDGSTDASGDYLDKWAEEDRRVFVIHKKNGGLASARNAALAYLAEKRVQGEPDSIIVFLDSDDMIEPRCVEVVRKKMNEENLDILEFEGRPIFESKELEEKNEGLEGWLRMHGDYSSVLTGLEYMERSGIADQKSCTWLRAYRTFYLLDEDLDFPDGLLHEDIFFAFSSVLNAKRAACLHEILYIYRIRKGSITNLKKDWANIKGRFIAELQMLSELEEHPELTQAQIDVAQGIIEECIISNYLDYIRCNPSLIKQKVKEELLPGDQMLFYRLLVPKDKTRVQ